MYLMDDQQAPQSAEAEAEAEAEVVNDRLFA
jgi:hypothetical protein